MNKNEIFDYIQELTRESAKELIKIYNNKDQKDRKTLLVFPETRDEKIRISEQEFRTTFINMHEKLNNRKLLYSIETPTLETYNFIKSGNKSSASTDLTFYSNNKGKKDKRVINIEFKAHNKERKTILTDFEKLVKEPNPGAWLHIFRNEDSGTIKSVFNKIIESLKELKIVNKKEISFHFLILETETLLSRKSKYNNNPNYYCDNIFNINYVRDWKNLEAGLHQVNDWQIEKFNI